MQALINELFRATMNFREPGRLAQHITEVIGNNYSPHMMFVEQNLEKVLAERPEVLVAVERVALNTKWNNNPLFIEYRAAVWRTEIRRKKLPLPGGIDLDTMDGVTLRDLHQQLQSPEFLGAIAELNQIRDQFHELRVEMEGLNMKGVIASFDHLEGKLKSAVTLDQIHELSEELKKYIWRVKIEGKNLPLPNGVNLDSMKSDDLKDLHRQLQDPEFVGALVELSKVKDQFHELSIKFEPIKDQGNVASIAARFDQLKSKLEAVMTLEQMKELNSLAPIALEILAGKITSGPFKATAHQN